ncbi:unnamed protein product [Rotaria sp. Silwood2]|nr:unnamed protein product [Rotaria sp. Silwood2]CAF2667260.1 unnamed protein product [Rotaria sp. Silwood2]CAF2935436.1 unnamed protein product [Rotaria sp. Silwood2]CAF3085776.1 unnamed protein product [Rotaria sp. Silwood2]CAF4109398.1 unnamed protein product [Rotaria sp. Silwood2]
MSKVGSAIITKQPRNYEIHNSFILMGNEIFLHEYTFEDGICGCSTTYHTTLTDTRLLTRSEITCCYNCSYEPDHMDASVFLRDIAEIREFEKTRHCCSSLCDICCECCFHPSSLIEVRGTFGSEKLYVSKADRANIQVEMPAAIANHKLITRY